MIDKIDGRWLAFHPQGVRALCHTKRDAQRLSDLALRYDRALWEYYARALYAPDSYPECQVPT